jgi:hypothetical protein
VSQIFLEKNIFKEPIQNLKEQKGTPIRKIFSNLKANSTNMYFEYSGLDEYPTQTIENKIYFTRS